MAYRYPPEYLECRSFRHDFHRCIHWNNRKEPFGRRISEECALCGAHRTALFSRITGENLTGWSYSYPEGYKPTEPMTKSDFRVRYFKAYNDSEVQMHGKRNGKKK